MEASGETSRRDLVRPSLGGGERYAEEVPFPKGAPPSEPWWDLGSLAERVLPEIQRIRGDAAELTDEQLGQDRRVIIEAETRPNFLAASHYPEDLFAATGLLPVGSRASSGTLLKPKDEDVPDQPAKRFLLSADVEALDRLERLYEEPSAVEGKLRQDALKFSTFSLESAEKVLKMGAGEVPGVVGDSYSFEAVMHPQLLAPGEVDLGAGIRVRDEFVAYLESLGGSANLDYARFEGNAWYLPVRIPQTSGVLGRVAAFTQLRALRPTPRLRPLRGTGESQPEHEAPIAGLPTLERRMAIFDGGIDPSALGLEHWVTERSLTDRPRVTAHHGHGVRVTSAGLFGSLDSEDPELKVPHTAIDHFRVWPMPTGVEMDIELPWVLDQIEKVVAEGRHKVFVITLAPALTAEDSDPHLWTVTLDRLAFEHDVLFVVAAGNTGDLEPGLDRILVPADLINGLSVGSCTAESGLAIRDIHSSVGPGRPGAMAAPTGVQFGGNLDARPFRALEPDGKTGSCEGTSYAAPVVARGCAELDALLEGSTSANLLRTLAVHHAERPTIKEAEAAGSATREVGYGRFSASYRDSFEHKPNEVTIVYDGEVKRNPMTAVRIPIPEDVFEAEPTRRFHVRWTLGFFAPVEPSNPVDYASAGIKVVFRPHRSKFTFTNKEGRTFGPYDLEKEPGIARVLADQYGAKQAQYPEAGEKRGVATEVFQRQFHGKWEGVVRMDRGMNGASLLDPRLDFHMLTREGGDLQKTADSLRYALVVTVNAPAGVELYDRTVAHAELLTPITTTVPVLVGLDETS